MEVGIAFQIPDHRRTDAVKFAFNDALRIFQASSHEYFSISLGQLFFSLQHGCRGQAHGIVEYLAKRSNRAMKWPSGKV